jgi:stalled ribosome rescue protein Dom34
MSAKNKKQFGIWMDSQRATIVGRAQTEAGDFVILGHEKYKSQGSNSSENAANNAERSLQQKFFKEIMTHMQNADELHVTGTGQVQEQLIKYLSETPQFKNTVAKESTSAQMSDEKLLEYFTSKFN